MTCTEIFLPRITFPFIALIARSAASFVAKLTKPYPLLTFVCRSKITYSSPSPSFTHLRIDQIPELAEQIFQIRVFELRRNVKHEQIRVCRTYPSRSLASLTLASRRTFLSPKPHRRERRRALDRLSRRRHQHAFARHHHRHGSDSLAVRIELHHCLRIPCCCCGSCWRCWGCGRRRSGVGRRGGLGGRDGDHIVHVESRELRVEHGERRGNGDDHVRLGDLRSGGGIGARIRAVRLDNKGETGKRKARRARRARRAGNWRGREDWRGKSGSIG